MCGIAGAIGPDRPSTIEAAVRALHRRGPDAQRTTTVGSATLGHARLSILDTSEAAHQPMALDHWTIVFNGEIYNFRALRRELEGLGHAFRTSSDTEVLLHAYAQWGRDCLEKLNGFFAFAIHDERTDELVLARDRMGIKPLYYAEVDGSLRFASELRALLELGIERVIDHVSVRYYMMLNYIPEPWTIFEDVYKLPPGHILTRKASGDIEIDRFYTIPRPDAYDLTDYDDAKTRLAETLDDSVRQRLVSDVPLGAFLSGGIDSSITAGLAARHTDHLHTFSIGFADAPYFDETDFARIAAKRFGTEHTVFSLRNADLFDHLHHILDAIDEPFADSSAIPVYILSQRTRQQVTVSLSGDGADELFGGYNKHMAEWRVRNAGLLERMVRAGAPVWRMLPKSRNGRWGNRFRQLDRFATGMGLSEPERYWRWCGLMGKEDASGLLLSPGSDREALRRKGHLLEPMSAFGDLNDVFLSDMHLVLVNDMLVKVDRMSMANSLEVRVPFLDHRVVDLAFRMPPRFKVDGRHRKRILREAFADLLPPEIMGRGKMGFEVPLLDWFRTDLRSMIEDDLLSDAHIRDQEIFDPAAIRNLRTRLFSNDPGDVHAQIWALIVFQTWWNRTM